MIFWHDDDESACAWAAKPIWANAGLGPDDMDFAMRSLNPHGGNNSEGRSHATLINGGAMTLSGAMVLRN